VCKKFWWQKKITSRHAGVDGICVCGYYCCVIMVLICFVLLLMLVSPFLRK
jgi:hypothetical protein